MTTSPQNPQGRAPEDVLLRARAGDTEALADILESVGAVIRVRIAQKISPAMRSSVDEDDVMQITYMEVFHRIGTFHSGGLREFTSWVGRMAENNLIDAVRAMESGKRPDPRRRITPARSAEDSMMALVNLLGVTNTTPSIVAARGEGANLLDRALADLPESYEKVIRLYDLQGKTIEEVCTELQKSEGAVYMLRARAHDRLKDLLGPQSNFFSTGA